MYVICAWYIFFGNHRNSTKQQQVDVYQMELIDISLLYYGFIAKWHIISQLWQD